jgi:phosphoglycolate phosphatase
MPSDNASTPEGIIRRATSFRAVVFDLDGTLIDTLADIATATNRVLRQHEYPEHPLEAFRMLVGSGVRTLMVRALPESVRQDDELVTDCVAGFHHEYDTCWHDQSQLYDGIAELLDRLTQCRLPLTVLSNKPHAFTVKCAEHFLARWPLALVLGQREGIAHKPDPAGALEIAQHLAVKPQQCLYIGDTSVDMQTATAAGMYALGVAWGFRTREELLRHGADRVINHPRELEV